jgi:hypothetical protein
MTPHLTIDPSQIAAFCRRRGIHSLALFGSVLRDDFRSGFEIFDIESELSHLLGGLRVDLVNRKYLNPRLRDRILAEREALYEG